MTPIYYTTMVRRVLSGSVKSYISNSDLNDTKKNVRNEN